MSEERPSERLAALGIQLPPVAVPVAAYVPAVRHGDLVYTSGQLPLRDGALLACGLVGEGPDAEVDPQQAYQAARAAALGAVAAAADLVGGVDGLDRVVRVTGFVASAAGFTGQPGVVNGASEVLGSLYPGGHARSAVGVAGLPLGAPVEIEAIFAVR